MTKRIAWVWFFFFPELTEEIASGSFIAHGRFYDKNVNLKFSFYSALNSKILPL